MAGIEELVRTARIAHRGLAGRLKTGIADAKFIEILIEPKFAIWVVIVNWMDLTLESQDGYRPANG